MAYVDIADIRQWFRENPALDDAPIEEVMEEMETYVSNYIDMYPLPPAHPLLKHIIRDLTISRLIFNITPAGGSNFDLAVELNRQAMSKLYQIKQDGLIIPGESTQRGNWQNQVFSRDSFWTIEDFDV